MGDWHLGLVQLGSNQHERCNKKSTKLEAQLRERDERIRKLEEWGAVLCGMILEYHDRSHSASIDECSASLCLSYIRERELMLGEG